MSELAVLVENKPGVLNRVISLVRSRGFNVDSLTVGRTENSELSRMTIVVDGCPQRLASQLRKLVNVVSVEDLTEQPRLSRDLALIKVAVNGQTRAEVLRVAEIFRANVVDAGMESLVLEVTGSEEKIWAIMGMLAPFGILEMVRTGMVAMSRGAKSMSTNAYQPRPYRNGKTPEPQFAITKGPFVV